MVRERPFSHEAAAAHSMTLSAPASSDCVTGRPIVFPVFNLIGSSKTVRLAYHRFIGMFQVRDPTRLLYDRNRLIFLAGASSGEGLERLLSLGGANWPSFGC